MPARKPPKRLFKNQDVIHAYQHDRSARAGLKHMTRDHVDVLQNIEFALVNQAREGPNIDDRMIDQALRSCMNRTDPPDDAGFQVVRLCAVLETTRLMREDVSYETWIAGLRTVDQSVRRHSNLSPGETSYLDFVQDYVR
ncbi:MAG: hypothetical protein ACHRXM_05200 [Isosphaerales bacterium]